MHYDLSQVQAPRSIAQTPRLIVQEPRPIQEPVLRAAINAKMIAAIAKDAEENKLNNMLQERMPGANQGGMIGQRYQTYASPAGQVVYDKLAKTT